MAVIYGSRQPEEIAIYLMRRSMAISAGRTARPMLDDLQLGFLADLAHIAPDGDALEIGTYFGSSALTWGCMRKTRGAMHIVDPFKAKAKQRIVFDLVMSAAGLYPIVYEGPSDDPAIIAQWPSAFSFAFIDGDHTRQGVRADIANVLPRIALNGIVAFHDYAENCQPVIDAVDELVISRRVEWARIGLVGSVIAFQRLLDA